MGGPHIYKLSFCLFAAGTKNTVPTKGPCHWSPGLIFGATCAIFRAGARPIAPGARRGSRGAKNRPRTRGQISRFILPKVCPETGLLVGEGSAADVRVSGELGGACEGTRTVISGRGWPRAVHAILSGS